MKISETLGVLRPIHPFPARMAPSIAMREIERLRGSHRILDPMVGSGTTTVLARMLGHRAYGVDIDPLSALLARTWASTVRSSTLRESAAEVLVSARERVRFLRQRDAYPIGVDTETKRFVRFWFDLQSRMQLRGLTEAIRECDSAVQPFLWASLSRTIITKTRGVSLAMDLSHSRPHRAFERAPVQPFAAFPAAVEHVASAGPFIDDRRFSKSSYPEVDISCGDARRLAFRRSSFDLVVTSPPYLNAIDYMRCSKFALVWMGRNTNELRNTRSVSIGAEVSLKDAQVTIGRELLSEIRCRSLLSSRWRSILDRYIVDMRNVILEISRVLKPGGRAVFVMGDSRLHGVAVSNSKIVELLTRETGLELEDREIRELLKSRRYLPPPSKSKGKGNFDQRMGQEVILRFVRRGA